MESEAQLSDVFFVFFKSANLRPTPLKRPQMAQEEGELESLKVVLPNEVSSQSSSTSIWIHTKVDTIGKDADIPNIEPWPSTAILPLPPLGWFDAPVLSGSAGKRMELNHENGVLGYPSVL